MNMIRWLMGKLGRKKDRFASREAEKYERPIPSREFILDYLAERGKPATRRDLINELNLNSDDEQEAIRRRLTAMVRDGQLFKNHRGTYGLVGKMELIAGRVIGHKDGFGFVVPDAGGDDLFLNGRQIRAVFHGDKVLARVSGLDHRGRSEAVVVEVLEHNTQQLVGRFSTESGTFFVKPVNHRITQDILIAPSDIADAQDGQMVVIAITEQPSLHKPPLGKVIEVMGDHMAPGMEIDVAIRNHDLPYEWPDDVLDESARFAVDVPASALEGRVDLRHLPFVTIDGEDAKDFDDAVYCVPDKNGWTLYVAIADVSHYVKMNSALDREAINRGNSVYFPERVIPMLPETLSNGLCSLKPKVDRLTQVCEMKINKAGTITEYKFHEAVIFSHARLTYNEVYAMIGEKSEVIRSQYQNLVPHLEDLFTIYHVLHQARKQRGAIDFDMPETKIVFGPDRKIERIVPTKRNDAHRVIEECMLCANICAAKFLLKNECPSLFRNHEGPNDEKLDDLRRFLNELALKLPGKKQPTPSDYAKLLYSIEDRPDAHIIQMMLLRSLSQAVYSPENKGHFGLAYDAYAHFTSPIRRYPDLLVHRTIRRILRNEKQLSDSLVVLEKHGEHCSMTERRADDATREVVDWLKCEFMLNKVGEDFPGVIGNVTGFGFFVELKDIYVEGLVHISTLPNDYYQFEATKQALRGERAGRVFQLGDVIKVRVARVDLDQRQIDFVLADEADAQSKNPVAKGRTNAKPKSKSTRNKKRSKKKST
ncbi:MAG: ribonuclease R [Gammaproteobacteria bacterium]|nr:ribonuclease R [Gammaproteobacteria bacterium]